MSDSPDRQDLDRSRRNVLAATGAGAAASMAGCLGVFDDDDDDDDDDPLEDVPDPDEIPMDGEFIASAGANPSTFDPTIITDATSNSVVGTLSYEGLWDRNFEFTEFEPALATDWERVDDETMEIQLREGVEFHNGDEFTAEDVQFSVERMRGTANDATVAWIEEVEIVDDHEIVVRAERPYAPFMTDLGAVPILPSDVDGITTDTPSEDDFRFDEESIGTGPFVLDNFEPEDRVELSRFEDYWWEEDEDLPGMAPWETVTIRVVPEQVSQQEAILGGELDMIDNPGPFELDIFDGEDPEVITGPQVGFDFVSFPVNVPPFSNEKFRRGMARLIPAGEIIDAIFGGNATELAGPISPGLATFWDPDHEQDLLDEWVGEDEEEGLALIEEALEEEDIEPPLEVDFITNVNRTRERWMEVIQNTMDETEFFDATLDIQDFDAMVAFLLDPEGAAESTDVVGIGWTGGSDPNGHTESLDHSDFHVPDGFNWNLYENEEVDNLIDQGIEETDIDERIGVYQELQEVLAEESPSAWMWTSDQIDVVLPDNVTNWRTYPNSSNRYWALYRPTLDQVAWDPE